MKKKMPSEILNSVFHPNEKTIDDGNQTKDKIDNVFKGPQKPSDGSKRTKIVNSMSYVPRLRVPFSR